MHNYDKNGNYRFIIPYVTDSKYLTPENKKKHLSIPLAPKKQKKKEPNQIKPINGIMFDRVDEAIASGRIVTKDNQKIIKR